MRSMPFVSCVVLVASQAGCYGEVEDLCGNGLVEPMEQCDDGNLEREDGCGTYCTIEQGWSCIDTLCRPACGDGIFVSGVEICDPSSGYWLDYCAEDCSEITGSCGDGIVQPEQESCEIQRGCQHCDPEFGFTCGGTPITCVATGLPSDRPMEDLDGDEMATYCAWLTTISGGEGTVFTCTVSPYVYTFAVSTVTECVAESADLDFRSCTVGDVEDWVADQGSPCGMAFSNPPCMS